jgi:hypothetical protein
MRDLLGLNRRIALHWLGSLTADQERYLSALTVCLGRFSHGPDDLEHRLAEPQSSFYNCLDIVGLNRHYLRFARLASRDGRGRFASLVVLGITMEQADYLMQLTNEAIRRLAFEWHQGELITFDSQALLKGSALHPNAAHLHAAALMTTRAWQ